MVNNKLVTKQLLDKNLLERLRLLKKHHIEEGTVILFGDTEIRVAAINKKFLIIAEKNPFFTILDPIRVLK